MAAAVTTEHTKGSPLRDRGFRMMLIGTIGLFCGYALLLPVVPLWVVAGGGSEFAAGASTGVFMATTVLSQLTVPALVRARGYRAITIWGALLIGVPSPLLIIATGWQPILAISLVRGIGFGFMTVCGSALIAEMLPRHMLARASGLYGLAVGLPQLLGLGTGTLLAEQWGFGPVFLLATALPLAGIGPMLLLPKVFPRHREPTRWLATMSATWRPWLVMLSGSIGFGSLATFLPIVLAETPVAASVALFAATGAALLSRWAAGALGDRLGGAGRILPAAAMACMLGLAGLAVATAANTALLAIITVGVFGIGFGAVQNDSLVAMFAATPAGQASMVWNIAWDGGTGLGAVVVGAVVSGAGYPFAFALLAALVLALVPVAVRARQVT